MKSIHEKQLRKRIKTWILLFMIGMVLSGATAFPIESLLGMVVRHIEWVPAFMSPFISEAYKAVQATNAMYPFLSYGTDWLAFAHIVIAVAFIGPYLDPVKNIWVIQFGMISCLMVFPLALIAGPIRGIPFYWQLLDCSFGLFGFVPLYLCYKDIRKLEQQLAL